MMACRIKFPLSAILIVLISGCTSITSETGIRIGDETLKQFSAGVTSEAWLVAILGPPTSQAAVEGIPGTFVYRYATGEKSAGLLSALSGNGARNTSVTYFIISDGPVTRFWADRAVTTTLLGRQVDSPEGEKIEK